MEMIKGIYADAKIFTDDAEEYAKAQVKMICDHEAAKGSTICLMPDIHPGKVGPIVQALLQYAEWNRQIIVREILRGMKWKAFTAAA